MALAAVSTKHPHQVYLIVFRRTVNKALIQIIYFITTRQITTSEKRLSTIKKQQIGAQPAWCPKTLFRRGRDAQSISFLRKTVEMTGNRALLRHIHDASPYATWLFSQ
jgi:hypothetical protein